MYLPSSVAITGASSGIGAGLALHYAKNSTHLFLTGRNEGRLNKVAYTCRAQNSLLTVDVQAMDVTDMRAVEQWIHRIEAIQPIDLLIANAGISAGTGIHGETAAQAEAIFHTNVDGVLYTVNPMLPYMKKRQHGQIAIMGSMAGFRGLPSAPAYSASKAAVRVYGEGLRGYLAKHGIGVSVICPGYVRTPMTEVNRFPMPFLMSADKAAARIARGLMRNHSRIAFPRRMYWPLLGLNMLPLWITDPFFATLPGKEALEEELPAR